MKGFVNVNTVNAPEPTIPALLNLPNFWRTFRYRLLPKAPCSCQGLAPDPTKNYDWLVATMRNGRRRIEALSWKRLAAIYYANRPASHIRQAINREARRCGYTHSTILAIHAEGSAYAE